ncbi:MAG: hypothetical protein KME26_27115 [Oscillatoria princeps RMCB-10]|nr:hypothetical protein [Oscillatoria princeps RMCB-10]
MIIRRDKSETGQVRDGTSPKRDKSETGQVRDGTGAFYRICRSGLPGNACLPTPPAGHRLEGLGTAYYFY